MPAFFVLGVHKPVVSVACMYLHGMYHKGHYVMNYDNAYIQEVKSIVKQKASGTINDALPEHVFVHTVYNGNWDVTLLSQIFLCEMLAFAMSILLGLLFKQSVLLNAVGLFFFS